MNKKQTKSIFQKNKLEKINKNLAIIKSVVLEMGGTIEEFVPERGCLYINVSGKRILLESSISITRQSFISERLTRYKEITYKLLLANALPTPKTICFYNKSYDKTEAEKKLNILKYPIILKHAVGSNSLGIFTSIRNVKEALKILKKKLPYYKSMIAQEMVFGKEYRVLILGEKVIGALEMIHPHIIGDGVSTIRKIIKQKQCTTDRRTKFDKKLIQILKSQNVSLRTVLPKKKIVYIKRNACMAEGGETVNVTSIVHQDVKNICLAASKAVGRNLVGIDIICKDIAKKPTKKTFNILEINARPDVYIHYDPTYGKTKNVLKDIIKFLVRVSASSSPNNK